ncbi:hypothetical protein, partial [Parendozoicomonas haliclonae]
MNHMGWKGTIRSVNAAVKRAERNARKRQRELELKQKHLAKMEALEQASYEVDIYNNHIDLLQSLHKECSSTIDWNLILNTPKPVKPEPNKKYEREALVAKANYKPSLIDKVLNRSDAKNKVFDKDILEAKKRDQEYYQDSLNDWEISINDRDESIETAKKVLENDPQTKLKVIEELDPFSELDSLGSNLLFQAHENSLIEITIKVHGKGIVPNEQKSLLQSGKLSVKKMPIGKFNEIYQDYVCSAILRVAREFFSILP